jgi:hypothetical protein
MSRPIPVENTQERRMNISWVLADDVILDPTQSVDDLKRLGPMWGSWRTWRAYQTDNVICHDQAKALELTKRNFQQRCNFYMSNLVYAALQRPEGVRLYAGEFVHDVVRQEEIVGLHLAASTSDIVLLLGWDLAELKPDSDKLRANQAQHHRNLVYQAIKDYDKIQWVAIDHANSVDPKLTSLSNFTVDTMATALTLAGD